MQGAHLPKNDTTKNNEKKTETKESLDRIRGAAQELHGAITDAAAKRGNAIKADLQAIPLKIKAVTESLKASLGAQSEGGRKLLVEGVTFLDATEKHVNEALKGSGQALQSSVRQAVTNARTSVQKVSEALAEKRTAESTHKKN